MKDLIRALLAELLTPDAGGEPAPGIKVGYARVSTGEQKLDLQIDALKKDGIELQHIHTEHVSAVARKRPALERALKMCRRGDTLVVWRLDRLARSLRDLINLTTELERRGVGLRSLTETIDTGSPAGRLIMHVIGAIGEFERQLIAERTRAGIRAHKERGGKFGGEQQIDLDEARKLLREGLTLQRASLKMGFHRNSLRHHISQTEALALNAEGARARKRTTKRKPK